MKKISIILIITAFLLVTSISILYHSYKNDLCDNSSNKWPYNSINYSEIKNIDNRPLSIAIIDTGINLSDPCFKNANIKIHKLSDLNETDNTHGTLITGIIYNSNIIPESIKKNLTIHAIDIGTDNKISITNLVKALKFAHGLNVDIINLSVGTYKNENALKSAINELSSSGTIIICASGNDSTKQYLYPAAYDNVISVASVCENNEVFINNNFNDKIVVSAPGENIPTGILDKDKKIISINGSSASTALTTCTSVVLKAISPSLNSSKLIDVLKNTSIDMGDIGKDDKFGYGMLNYKDSAMYCKNHFLYQIYKLFN